MHSHHNGANRIVFAIALEHAREPLHLCWIELVVGNVIEINEIDSVADPVKISLRLRGFGIIFQPPECRPEFRLLLNAIALAQSVRGDGAHVRIPVAQASQHGAKQDGLVEEIHVLQVNILPLEEIGLILGDRSSGNTQVTARELRFIQFVDQDAALHASEMRESLLDRGRDLGIVD